MKLLVVGAGEMGRWFAEIAAAELDAEIAFADADPEIAEEAATKVDSRAVSLSTEERFDAVCVAVPMAAAEEAIADHAPKAEHAILDLTGQMADPVATMAEAAPDRERVSLHPLFAPGNAPGNVAVVADEPGPVTDRILDGLRAVGNDLVETTPEEHDEAMATVQASTHAAVLAFALAAEEVPEGLTTPIFEELSAVAEQVTGNESRVYAEIQDTFDGAESVAKSAAQIADAVEDSEAFERLYSEAGERLDSATEENGEHLESVTEENGESLDSTTEEQSETEHER